MSEMLDMLKKYSVENDRRINQICSPLINCLNIPIFSYEFIEADGSIGFITNAIEYMEYYYSEGIYLHNPYLSHPALFRTGSAICPVVYDYNTLNILRKKFKADHLLLEIESNGSQMEHFIFADENLTQYDGYKFFQSLDLLNKFKTYFKKEARDLIGRMKAEQYNIRALRGKDRFENTAQVPLRHKDPNILSFLQQISCLSPNELRELEEFKQIPFTRKEKEVVQQLLKGNYASEAATNLFLSKRTIEKHLDSIKQKLDCHTRTELFQRIRNLESIGSLF